MSTASLEPLALESWNSRTARHLLNRAGFGIPHGRVAELAAMTPEEAVDSFVEYQWTSARLPEPDFVVRPPSRAEVRERLAGLSGTERQEAVRDYWEREREAVEQLRPWWFERMLRTTRPLEEKLALFWHGHFATSAQKVRQSKHNYDITRVFRRHAAGNFRTLTHEIAKSPAMLIYLDTGRSTRAHPNENWAREMLELFTMGHGHYTEDDIKQAARAFTGWDYDRDQFVFNERQHDFGEKTFLGRTGPFHGEDIIDIVFEQDATARHICRELWTYFAGRQPRDEVVVELSELAREADYELRPVLKCIFLSRAFYGDAVVGAQVKSPAQLTVQLCCDMALDPVPAGTAVHEMAQLGQDLLRPPNVKGWDGNEAWVSVNTLLRRFNLPAKLIAAQRKAAEEAAPPVVSTVAPATQDPGHWTPPEPWRAGRVFEGLEFDTARGCIDALEDRFLSVALSGKQRAVLADALGASSMDTPVTAAEIPEDRQTAVLHLLTSTPQYQLC